MEECVTPTLWLWCSFLRKGKTALLRVKNSKNWDHASETLDINRDKCQRKVQSNLFKTDTKETEPESPLQRCPY